MFLQGLIARVGHGSKMRQGFANTSAFSEPALSARRAHVKQKAEREKHVCDCARGPPPAPGGTQSGRSRGFRRRRGEPSGFPEGCARERDPEGCAREKDPEGCRHSCQPARCSEAGLLTTRGKTVQRPSAICPPCRTCPSMPSPKFSRTRGREALRDWAWLATGNHRPCSFLA